MFSLFSFLKSFHLTSLSSFVALCLYVPLNCLCLSPKGADAWITGNQKVSRGLYQQGEPLLRVALQEGKNSQAFNTRTKIVHLIANDLAACLEKKGAHENAASLYESVVAEGRRLGKKIDVCHVGALRGLIRCRLALGLPVEELVDLMNKWHPRDPASYLAGSVWVIVPFCSPFDSSEPSVTAFLSDFFSLPHSQAKDLLSIGVRSVSSVYFFDIGRDFLDKLASLGKSMSEEELLFTIRDYTSRNSPLLAPSNQEQKLVAKHGPIIERSSDISWVAQWKSLFSREFTSAQLFNQLVFLLDLGSSVQTPKELRARVILERGILARDLSSDIKMARGYLLEASRSDEFGLTRTSASAVAYVLSLAAQQKDILLGRKSFNRAEKRYLFAPKFLDLEVGDITLMSADPYILETIRDSILSASTKEVTGWVLPPREIIVSASGCVLFWRGFEEDLTTAPKLKKAMLALKVMTGNGFFWSPPKGWLLNAIRGDLSDDDI
ncbi:hypothetical protein [Candidatus Similichlamydia epinepheli]|uniref:hypothetical protein n=1 Tax=Candidatus Similichlamydia epinepheli TaxID=1903953 RepID=UPI001300A382|nr:hypothetical protein [Candidatus Similichlamydia epinepheli]